MRDASYFRAQAALCLEIARQMSDAKTAEDLKEEAARYRAAASAVESEEKSVSH
jgi:hypothetical protein